MSAARHRLGLALRLSVTLGILWLIFRNIDLHGVLAVIRTAGWPALALALLMQLLSTWLAGFRWYLVMRELGFGFSSGFYVRSYFKGAFFNQGLPTSIGGDAMRVLDVAGSGFRKRDAFKGVFIDRILGLLGLLLLNLMANALLPDLLPRGVFWIINALVAGGVAGFLTLVFLHRLRGFERWRPTAYLLDISRKLHQVLRGPRRLLRQLGLSLAIHALSILNIFLVGRSVGLDYDIVTFAVIAPPVFLLTLIPVSLAGWGVREGAMIGLFTLLGADKTVVLSMSILYGIILILASLPGLLITLRGRLHRRAPDRQKKEPPA